MIRFDVASADALSQAANKVASRLRDLGRERIRLADEVLVAFRGNYARVFERICVVESESRSILAREMDNLADTIRYAKVLAEQEKNRIEKHRRWQSREKIRVERRRREQLLGLPTTAYRHDPEPSNIPLPAPVISAAALIQQRNRRADSARMSTSSARVESLRRYAAHGNGENLQLLADYYDFYTAWNRFTFSCSWVRVERFTLINDFSLYIEENKIDAIWVEHIADIFELAGTGELANAPSKWVRDLSLDIAANVVERYRSTKTVFSILVFFHDKDFSWKKIKIAGKSFSISPVSGLLVETGTLGKEVVGVGLEQKTIKAPHLADHPSIGNIPKWAKAGSSGLRMLSAGLTYYEHYNDSYKENLLKHPDWTEGEINTASMLGAGVSTASSVVVGSAGAELGLTVGMGIGSFFPPFGTLVGGLVGATVGGYFGGKVGEDIGKRARGSVTDSIMGIF